MVRRPLGGAALPEPVTSPGACRHRQTDHTGGRRRFLFGGGCRGAVVSACFQPGEDSRDDCRPGDPETEPHAVCDTTGDDGRVDGRRQRTPDGRQRRDRDRERCGVCHETPGPSERDRLCESVCRQPLCDTQTDNDDCGNNSDGGDAHCRDVGSPAHDADSQPGRRGEHERFPRSPQRHCRDDECYPGDAADESRRTQ